MRKNKKEFLLFFLLFLSLYLMFNKDLNLFLGGKLKQIMFANYYAGLENLENLNKEFHAFKKNQMLNFEKKEALEKELQKTKEQHAILSSNYNKILFENNLLRKQQRITLNHYERQPIATFKVIYFSKGARYLIYARINPQQKRFLKPKMPVYSNGFLIGNINKVFDDMIEVNFINSVNFQIPFVAQKSKIRGLLSGRNSEKMGLSFLYYKQNVSFEENELLLTSDKFESIPKFIPIAVIKFNKRRMPYAIPAFDIDKITYISVINFKGQE